MRVRTFLLRLGAVGGLLAGLLGGPAQAASAWGMTVAPGPVEPSSYTGPCDGGLYHSISGKITVDSPMTVKYIWIDQRGLAWPSPTPFSLVFDAPGTKTFSTGFYLDKSRSGQLWLRIVDPPIDLDAGPRPFDTTCVQAGVSALSTERVDEGCETGQSAEFALKANLSATDGPATIGYRWYRKSNLTRNQWVSFATGSASFTSDGQQQQTISARYATGVSEYGSFKVELTSPYQGTSGPTSFIVTCGSGDL